MFRAAAIAILSLCMAAPPAAAGSKQGSNFEYRWWKVREGDTLWEIAGKLEKYGVTVQKLRNWNPLVKKYKHWLRPKRRLRYLVPKDIARAEEAARRERAERKRKAAEERKRRAAERRRKKRARQKVERRKAAAKADASKPAGAGEGAPAEPVVASPAEQTSAPAEHEEPEEPEEPEDPVAAMRGELAKVDLGADAPTGQRQIEPAATPLAAKARRKRRTEKARAEAAQRARRTGEFPDATVVPDFELSGPRQASAIGSPSRGRLENGVELPKRGKGFVRINHSRRWATDQTIALIEYAGERLKQRFPGTRPLLVGALSQEHGGRAGGHKSHQNGLDVDVAYFEKGNPTRSHYNARVRASQIDWKKTWFLFETWLLTGKINYIFVDRSHLRHLRREARRSGWRGEALRKLFGDDHFDGAGRIIRHWPGHTYHAHVRFVCPESDDQCRHSHY